MIEHDNDNEDAYDEDFEHLKEFIRGLLDDYTDDEIIEALNEVLWEKEMNR